MNERFEDITPPEGLLREPVPGGRFAVAELGGTLYVAELVHDANLSRDRCRLLGYGFERPRWETDASLEIFGGGEAVPDPAPPSVRCLTLREPGAAQEALFVRFASPLGTRLLRLAPGGEPEWVADAGPWVERCFGFTRLAELDGRLFGLGPDEDGRPGRICEYRPQLGVWQEADLPPFADGGRRVVAEIVACGGALYAATVDGERGFELWRADAAAAEPEWKAVFERGAWRYAHNREAFAVIRHGDALYLFTGTAPEARRPESKFFDYQGFEVIRVAPDGTWDLLVGVPRFSPGGLVVPLSGLGAGMHPGLGLELRAAVALGGRLLMGLHGIDGFRLWSSADGETWTPSDHAELAAIHRVDACRAIPLGDRDGHGERLALVLDTTDPAGERATEIWAGRPGGEAVGD